MLELDIQGFGVIKLEYLISDFTGTLSLDGRLLPGVKEKISAVSKFLEIYVLTADAFGTAKDQLTGIPCKIQTVTGHELDKQKELFVKQLGAEKVVAIGNGMNDAKMLKASRLGIAVAGREGCCVASLLAADVCVVNVNYGLDLLLNPKRLQATLQF